MVKITEISNNTNYTWEEKSERVWYGKFSVETSYGKVDYFSKFIKVKTHENEWDISFELTPESKELLNVKHGTVITGSGNAFEVFSIFMTMLKEFINVIHPDIITFMARHASRIKLYSRMFATIPGYEIHKQMARTAPESPKLADFTMTKKQEQINEISKIAPVSTSHLDSATKGLALALLQGKSQYYGKLLEKKRLGEMNGFGFYRIYVGNYRVYILLDDDVYNRVKMVDDALEDKAFIYSPRNKYAKEHINDSEYKKLIRRFGSIENLEKLVNEKQDALYHGTMIKGFLSLNKFRLNWESYQVGLSYLDPSLRGKGIGKKIYNYAVLHDKIILVSGDQQTKSSRALWKSFILDDRYQVWAQDLRNLSNIIPVYLDDETGELPIDLEKILYSSKVDKTEWRLIAIAAKNKRRPK